MSSNNIHETVINVPGIDIYFPNSSPKQKELIQELVNKFQIYLREVDKTSSIITQIKQEKFIKVDYEALKEFDSNFEELLCENGEFFINSLNLSVYQFIEEQYTKENQKIPILKVKITNHSPILQIREINASCLNKFISLKGTVIKASPIEIRCDYLAFDCVCCNTVQLNKQINGCFTPLEKCKNCGTLRRFQALCEHPETRTVPAQRVVLQENEGSLAGIPQTIECELTESLVKNCLPGDEIIISGVIKVTDPNDNRGKNKQNSLFTPFLYANCLTRSNSSSRLSQKITFNTRDYLDIKKIHAHSDLFSYLVHSLCPTIYGHELVKAGLLLGLFGGKKSGNSSSRSESHILIVGDPGLGKSQMLKSCANLSPRGVYVCGSESTTSGLTVTMSKESSSLGNGEYSLEAGALLIADRGCCCIDELDKMSSAQHACLLEVMEQQTISIAKAGVVCSIPTRPTVLVAANPVLGHYDKSKTVAENLKIGSPILSRFDLVFILLDKADEELDKYLTKHVLKMHHEATFSCSTRENTENRARNDDTLKSRLKTSNWLSNEILPHENFTKYLVYAQKYVQPQLNGAAKEILKDFYLNLRKTYSSDGNSTPVTPRQLQALIRLTEARAKVELREEATAEDAKDVIEIMQNCLEDIFSNENGALDTTRSIMGSGMSYKKQIMKTLERLHECAKKESKYLFTREEIKSLAVFNTSKFNETLESLNTQGYLINKGNNMFKLNSSYL